MEFRVHKHITKIKIQWMGSAEEWKEQSKIVELENRTI